jgi:hypothetical protein
MLLAADRESSTERGSPDVRAFTTQEQAVTKVGKAAKCIRGDAA